MLKDCSKICFCSRVIKNLALDWTGLALESFWREPVPASETSRLLHKLIVEKYEADLHSSVRPVPPQIQAKPVSDWPCRRSGVCRPGPSLRGRLPPYPQAYDLHVK
ncbi:hypothetical protein EVAR_70472_1 [Eumeta japonica]|uniref:Uncharacterized protein n=1 Tax=Eumeta variegata TaxID=151549 RepID=A0A4C2AA34_EUMVA|nr:hypothetical protein EVAR_70472_1 [Eumeta japonica]